MNKLIITVFAVVCFASGSCRSNNRQAADEAGNTTGQQLPKGEAPVLTLAETSHDFGTIKAGEKVEYSFNFTNTGKTPLQIVNAVASCGCTVPEYPTKPILPGEKGNLRVRFDSEGKEGMQDKVVTIYSNAATEQLHITANIK